MKYTSVAFAGMLSLSAWRADGEKITHPITIEQYKEQHDAMVKDFQIKNEKLLNKLLFGKQAEDDAKTKEEELKEAVKLLTEKFKKVDELEKTVKHLTEELEEEDELEEDELEETAKKLQQTNKESKNPWNDQKHAEYHNSLQDKILLIQTEKIEEYERETSQIKQDIANLKKEMNEETYEVQATTIEEDDPNQENFIDISHAPNSSHPSLQPQKELTDQQSALIEKYRYVMPKDDFPGEEFDPETWLEFITHIEELKKDIAILLERSEIDERIKTAIQELLDTNALVCCPLDYLKTSLENSKFTLKNLIKEWLFFHEDVILQQDLLFLYEDRLNKLRKNIEK